MQLTARVSSFASSQLAWEYLYGFLSKPIATVKARLDVEFIRIMLATEYELPSSGAYKRSDALFLVQREESIGVYVVAWLDNVVLELNTLVTTPFTSQSNGIRSTMDKTVRSTLERLSPLIGRYSEDKLLAILPTLEEAELGGVPIKKSESYEEFSSASYHLA